MSLHEPRETSGATTALVVRHVRARAGEVGVAELLSRTGGDLSVERLEDVGHWVGHDTRLRLFRAAAEVVDDPQVTVEIGAEAASAGLHPALVLLLRTFGSVAGVLRQVDVLVPKFTTTADLRVVDVAESTAAVEYRVVDGYEPSPLDCGYVEGLLSAVPRVFGLDRGEVRHERCQSRGDAACSLELSWERPRGRRASVVRRRGQEVELDALRGQLEQLQSAAADLVSADDLTTVVDRIVERAVAAVLAPGYLLVVDDVPGRGEIVHADGLTPERAAEVAEQIAATGGADGVTVVELASGRRRHGRLAVLHGQGSALAPAEVQLLEAYARHAAAALDLLTALESSRREERRATALLELADALAEAEGTVAVGEVVTSALPGVVGCRAATLMLWHASEGELRAVAVHGHTEEQAGVLLSTGVRADQTPELGRLLTHRKPVLLDVRTASPGLRDLLAAVGADGVVVVPLLAGETLLGVLTAAWGATTTAEHLDEEATARVVAVARQAATALENAHLLEVVRHQSLHDALTGLPNRVLFQRTLDERLRATGSGSGTAVLFCDVDRFKHVNDFLGHAAGDELLRQVAARVRGVLRPGDVVGRLSGDEFAVLVSAVDERAALAVAQRVVGTLDQTFRIEGRDLRVTASVGVALHTGTDGRGDRLLAAADAAMYEAKQRGRNQVAVAGHIPDRMVVPSLEAELGRAVEAGQLRLLFQPVVDLRPDGGPAVVGAEALLRWAHPRLGLLPPGAFLPLAEEAGLVTELDLWAVDAACAALAAWPEHGPEPMRVAVNLAGSTLVDPRLPGRVRAALTAHDVAPEQLHLEVVESRSLVDLPGVVDHLEELRQMGLRIALDDFGTGYSTLAWLQALPVDQVKVDRSFVMRLPHDPASAAVVRGVVALACEMGLEVVAEGVETGEQLRALHEAGCRWIQGYLLGRPAPLLDLGAPAAVAVAQLQTSS